MGSSNNVDLGLTKQLTATANYSDGSSSDVTTSASWSTASTSIATVETTGQSKPGLVSGVSIGSTTITASFQGTSGSASLTVNAPTGLSISPSDPTISVGQTLQFTATATYADGLSGNVTSLASWVSSDPSKAKFQTAASPGLITAISAASPGPDISAVIGSLNPDTILTITSTAAQTGLSLSAVNPSLNLGASLQLIAVADFADGSSQVIPANQVTWSSKNALTAAVTDGLVTGIAPGTTTIGAIYSAPGASCTPSPCQAKATVTVNSSAQTIPLMDMSGTQNYLGFDGGLYGSGSNTVPAAHDTDGKTLAAQITPLDQSGKPSATGAVVFLGIGMSNATIEFSNFVTTAAADAKVNHTNLAIVNGAHGAVTACPWTVGTPNVLAGPICGIAPGSVPAQNQYDRVRDTVLATAVGAPSAPANCGAAPAPPCLTEAQVQVIWIKNANPDPGLRGYCSITSTANCPKTAGATDCAAEIAALPVPQTTPETEPPTEACRYEWQMGQTVRAAKSRYPNLKLVFFSTRIYSGYATKPLNPEPYAYEYGFSGQWLVQAQIGQMNGGPVDPVAGDLDYTGNGAAGAWLGWSSYLWANGTTPRSDGLIWCGGQSGSPCAGEQDFELDGTHPSGNNPGHDGASKIVSGQAGSKFTGLMGFFKTSPYTAKWFCASGVACGP